MRISDWSSDVCSSDLVAARPLFDDRLFVAFPEGEEPPPASISPDQIDERRLLLLEDGHCLKDHALAACNRPELRAEATMMEIGRAACRKECVSQCRSRWSPYH